MTKYWVTKYALTKGIKVLTDQVPKGVAEYVRKVEEEYLYAKSEHGYLQLYNKSEWFLSEEEAVRRAEELRLKKLASLEKQIQKLKKLKFETSERAYD